MDDHIRLRAPTSTLQAHRRAPMPVGGQKPSTRGGFAALCNIMGEVRPVDIRVDRRAACRSMTTYCHHPVSSGVGLPWQVAALALMSITTAGGRMIHARSPKKARDSRRRCSSNDDADTPRGAPSTGIHRHAARCGVIQSYGLERYDDVIDWWPISICAPAGGGCHALGRPARVDAAGPQPSSRQP